MPDDRDRTAKEFHEAVNMTPVELERWLATGESESAGQRSGDEESIGHRSGRRIVSILRESDRDLSDDDYAHMRKVVGYVRRHLAQRPDGDVTDTRWRRSLMNWGHDPLK
ncbi:DUF3140 domain-containing protein [Sphaerisporangium sp. B11E5]|uniref:DUF3140 domain-containing protein n=1 Tax=Sphaerisporangium sp. B11E5 TaxID=3153563 RepID=UPI00325C7075